MELELKPAFPAWMRRYDPLLDAGETNALFDAFRRRRFHTRRRRLRFSAGEAITTSVSVILFVGVGYLLFTRGFSFTSIAWYAILASVVIHVFQWLLHHDAPASSPLPRSSSALLGSGAADPTALADVWLTGASGRDFAEAIYLELNERNRSSLIGGPIILFVMQAGIYFAICHFVLKTIPVGDTIYFLAMLTWFSVELAYGWQIKWQREIVDNMLREARHTSERISSGSAILAGFAGAMRAIGKGAVLVAFGLSIAIIVSLAGMGAVQFWKILSASHSGHPVVLFLKAHWALVLWSLFVVPGIIYLRTHYHFLRHREADRRRLMLEEAGRHYDVAIAAYVTADPDSIAFALLNLREARATQANPTTPA